MPADLLEPLPSRYVVGIDLGTTNSAACFVDTAEKPWKVRVLEIPQLVAPGQVEARDTRDPNSPWKLYLRVAMTNAIQTIAPLPSDDLAFRVSELVAEPPALRILGLGNQQTQVILFGVPGQGYRLESKPVLDDAAAWQNGPSVVFTNAFRIFPASSSIEPSRFYRAQKL